MYLMVTAVLWGLFIGSLLNVAIERLPMNRSLGSAGSTCPICGHKLSAVDLVPVISFVARSGRCRYCRGKIPWRYPLVEVLTGLIFAVETARSGLSLISLHGWVFACLLIIAAFSDWETGLIPNSVTYSGMLIGLILSPSTIGIANSLIGMFSFAGILLAVSLLSSGGIGGGDIKLAGVIGAFLGIFGAWMTLLLASLLGCMGVVRLMWRGECGRRTLIRFGPYLAAASYILWIYEQQIIYYLINN